MTFIGQKDYGLEASLGLVDGVTTINKFGEALDCDSGDPTDIWDGANTSGGGAVGTKIWIPPTTARVHQLTSSNINDTLAGSGAQTVEVFYLPNWTSSEVSIMVDMNGTSDVALPSMVMINRMEVMTSGVNGLNAGDITATADTDGTVTSAILAGNNQTQQCILGVPSTQKLRVKKFISEIVKGTGSSQRADGVIYMMRDPATNTVDNTQWTNKESFLLSEGNNPWTHDYGDIPKKFDGGCIVKIQITSNSNGTKAIGGFDAYLVDNL